MAGELVVGGSGLGGNLGLVNYTQTSFGKLHLDLGSASTSDRLTVLGTVNLAGTLDVWASAGFGEASYTLIDNLGPSPVIGIFDNLAEGTIVTVNGSTYWLSYQGGDGNDVVLTHNTAPVAGTPTFNVNHDVTLNVTAANGLIGYCVDNDNDPLSIVAIDGFASNVGNYSLTMLGSMIVVQADGSFIYYPPTGVTGVDSFTFTVSDGHASATSTCTINVNNVAPSLGTPSYSTTVNTVLTSDPPLLFWCVDNDGDQLHISQINGHVLVSGSITLNLENGATITVNDDGTFEYTPADDLEYDEELTFTVFDGIAEVTASWFIHITAN